MYCYCVYTAISAGYSICYHVYNKEIVFGIVTYIYDTQLPYLCALYKTWKLIAPSPSLSLSYPVGLSPLGLFTNRT